MTHYGRTHPKPCPDTIKAQPKKEVENAISNTVFPKSPFQASSAAWESCHPLALVSPPDLQLPQKAGSWILALGCAAIAGFFLFMTVPQPTSAETDLPQGVVAVMSTAVTQEKLTMPMEQEEEPFGYMNGEWNVWEYIGDLLWSLLS